MADPPSPQSFPTDDALCEQCGYPLKGLTSDAVCPECGYAVAESAPAKRTIDFAGPWLTLNLQLRMMHLFFFHPKQSFRSLVVSRENLVSEQYLFRASFLAGLILSAIVYLGSAFIITPRYHTISLLSAMWLFVLTAIGVSLLTFIEMMGVTAFSRRRGWRVPFPLAMRICCLASVGWLPGSVFAGLGIWMIQAFGVGRPWFDHLFGLVRVGWLVYGGLFVISFLWFETLVWIGVRQVRYANAWPNTPIQPAQDTPQT